MTARRHTVRFTAHGWRCTCKCFGYSQEDAATHAHAAALATGEATRIELAGAAKVRA